MLPFVVVVIVTFEKKIPKETINLWESLTQSKNRKKNEKKTWTPHNAHLLAYYNHQYWRKTKKKKKQEQQLIKLP